MLHHPVVIFKTRETFGAGDGEVRTAMCRSVLRIPRRGRYGLRESNDLARQGSTMKFQSAQR